MAIEIERKFLVVSDAWQDQCIRKVALCDALLLAADGRKLRVRISDDRAMLTFKGRRSGLARQEFDFEIPLPEARDLLQHHSDGRILEKTRHIVPFGDLVWEVDVYGGVLAGIVIAEVELPSEGFPLLRPDWIGEEVTGREDFRKINLLRARVSDLLCISDLVHAF